MGKLFKRKGLLFLTTGVSLLATFVAAVSTMAWFQINAQPVSSSLVAGDASISIGNTFGYKVNPVIGGNGFIDYSNSQVAKVSGNEIIDTTNEDQDGLDTNFDVPYSGIGYYLVKMNPAETFKYSYGADHTTYNKKFVEVEDTTNEGNNKVKQ